MSNFNTSNIKAVVNALNKQGIVNKHVQLGILATISKESAFNPKIENGYGGTPASRIRGIWPSLFPSSGLRAISDAQIDVLKKDNVKFFDHVYNYPNNVLGNTQPGDGYRYVGRGFNGITGRAQYKKYSELSGVDLINHPERLNEIPIAALVNALYFKRRFSQTDSLKKQIGVDNVDQIKDDTTGLKAALAANAGWGKNMNDAFHIENEQRALKNIEYLRQFVTASSVTNTKNLLPLLIALISVAGIAFTLNKLYLK